MSATDEPPCDTIVVCPTLAEAVVAADGSTLAACVTCSTPVVVSPPSRRMIAGGEADPSCASCAAILAGPRDEVYPVPGGWADVAENLGIDVAAAARVEFDENLRREGPVAFLRSLASLRRRPA